jgi:hypothetical protein
MSSAQATFDATPDTAAWSPWQESSVLSLIGMEMVGVALWLRILSQTGRHVSFGRAWLTLFLIAALCYLINRLFEQARLRISLRRGILLVFLIGCIYWGLRGFLPPGVPAGFIDIAGGIYRSIDQVSQVYPTEIILVLGILWTIYRGISLATNPYEYSTASGRFGAGIFWLGIYCLVAPFTGQTHLESIYLFLLCGLLALSLGRIYGLQFVRGSRRIPFTLSWFMGVLGSVLLVVGVSWLVSYLMWQWGASAVSFVFVGAFRVIMIVGSVIFLPVLLALLQLAPLLQELIDQFPGVAQLILGLLASLRGIVDRILSAIQKDVRLPASSGPVIIWGILILAVILIMLSLRYADKRRRQGSLDESEEDIGSWGAQSWGQRWRALQNRLGIGLRGRPLSHQLARARIRRIYVQLMTLCATMGLPRPKAQTPLEYLPAMQSVFPNNQDDLALITRAYLLVRYGELPEDEGSLQEIENAWSRVEEIGRKNKSQPPKKAGGG